jgi:hypothetical protein
MKAKRIKFAQAYLHFTAEDWSKVMYLYKPMLQCIRASRCKVRRPERISQYESKYMVKTGKHPDSVMVWGCFASSVWRDGLYFLPRNTTMNGERYQ